MILFRANLTQAQKDAKRRHQELEKQLDEDSDSESDADEDGDEDKKEEKAPTFFSRMHSKYIEPVTSLFKKKKKHHHGDKDEAQEPVDDKPADYYSNPEYHQDKSIIIRWYLQYVCQYAQIVAVNETFSNIVLFVIIIAGINVGCQTYESLSKMYFFTLLDTIILIIFSVEAVIKIFAEGLRIHRYWIGPEWKWNNFDFVIIMLSLPFWSDLFGSGSIALLRLVRLSRLGKIIRKIPALQMIVQGLLGGLSSIGYILLLLFLVFYLYGVVGFYIFRVGDPFHFGTLFSALLTLFRVSLLESWADVMYVNTFGCDVYPAFYIDDPSENTENGILWCTTPVTNYILAPVYFISFVVISALVMMSLFVGAVTMSMTESMDEMKAMAEEKKKKEAFEKNKLKIEMMQRSKDEDLIVVNRSFSQKMMSAISSKVLFAGVNAAEAEADSAQSKMSYALKLAMGELSEEDILKEEARKNEEDRSKYEILNYYAEVGSYFHYLGYHPKFQNLVTLVILMAGFNVGAQTDPRVLSNETMAFVLSIFDYIISVVFTLEVILKLVGEKLHPGRFFKDNWNKFDFFIVVASFIPAVGSIITVLRLLRLLRLLKLIKRLPQLAVIINALILGLGSIGYVGVILFLAFYVFAILGMMLFGVNDPWHFGTLHMSLITLFRAATLDNTFGLIYVQMFGCDVFQDVYETFPEQCTDPQAQPLFATAYFVFFVTLAAQVLLTLFIGVISTSMDQARQAQKKEQKLEEDLENIRKERGFHQKQTDAFVQVFSMLDLDNGGTIEEEELKIGLNAINVEMSADEIQEALKAISAEEDGIDVIGFIKFMCKTPKYKAIAAGKQSLLLMRKKTEKKKHEYDFFTKIKRAIWPSKKRSVEEMIAAAMIIQDAYRAKMAKREALKRLEEEKKKKELREQRRQQHLHHHHHKSDIHHDSFSSQSPADLGSPDLSVGVTVPSDNNSEDRETDK